VHNIDTLDEVCEEIASKYVGQWPEKVKYHVEGDDELARPKPGEETPTAEETEKRVLQLVQPWSPHWRRHRELGLLRWGYQGLRELIDECDDDETWAEGPHDCPQGNVETPAALDRALPPCSIGGSSAAPVVAAEPEPDTATLRAMPPCSIGGSSAAPVVAAEPAEPEPDTATLRAMRLGKEMRKRLVKGAQLWSRARRTRRHCQSEGLAPYPRR
jgi:hypothetical protein